MSLYKRREWYVVTPNSKRHHPFGSTPDEAPAKAAALATRHGITAWTLWRDPQATYTCSLIHRKKRHCIDTQFADLPSATKFETAFRKSLAADRLTDLKGISLRQDSAGITIAELLPHWRAFATARGISETARRQYEHAMRAVWQRATTEAKEEWEKQPVSTWTASLVFRFKEAIGAAAQAEEDDSDLRAQQMRRSANSTLRQAKGMFSAAAREHYQLVAGITLPATVSEFLRAPGFPDTTKADYNLPADDIVRRTFAALEATRESHPNRYIAVWLALGFGLRKSEIAAVRAGWFKRLGSGIKLELETVVRPGGTREKGATKNGERAPVIDCSNGAWEKLEPLIGRLQETDYVLQTPTATDRVEGVFRGISAWMQELGWDTQKQVHEFRAFGGCQVATRDGIEAASRWLRHSSIMVTQKHYGRYLSAKVTDAAIALPEAMSQT